MKQIFRPFLFVLALLPALFCPACSEKDGPAPGDLFAPYSNLVKDFTRVVYISYEGTAVTVSGPGADAITYTTDASHPARLTITSSAEDMAYFVCGTTSDGQLKIYSDYKYALYLNGARITSTDGPAINNQCRKSCYLVLCPGSINRLTDSDTYTTEYGADGAAEKNRGCLYSRGQIYMVGTGTLAIDCTGRVWYDEVEQDSSYVHGININDYFICQADVRISIDALHGDGLHVKDSVISVSRGTFGIRAGKCGINCKESEINITGGTFSITAATDDAIKDSLDLYITDGTFTLTSRQGYGLRSKGGSIIIEGGTFDITAADDALRTKTPNGQIIVSGGTLSGTSANRFFRTEGAGFTLNGATCFAAAAKSSPVSTSTLQYVYQARPDTVAVQSDSPLTAYDRSTRLASFTPRQSLDRPYLLLTTPTLTSGDSLRFVVQ